MNLVIKSLKAFHGDSFLVTFESDGINRNILVDSGPPRTYSRGGLKREFNRIKESNEKIDLWIISHIDDDHIGGITRFFEHEDENRELIRKVWFNSGQLIADFLGTKLTDNRNLSLILRSDPNLSVGQGITLESKLKELDCWEQRVIYNECNPIDFLGSKITILSPDIYALEKLNKKWETEKGDVFLSGDRSDFSVPITTLNDKEFEEDSSPTNESSISILFEFNKKKVLFLADAHPTTIVSSLKKLGYSKENPIKIDLMKVSHHGSKGNTSPELLNLIKCNQFFISTNGNRNGLPDKESIARIIAANSGKTHLFFNYDIFADMFLPEDKGNYNFECKYLENGEIILK